jgi:ribose transport system substrate-binding protein
MMHFFKTNDGDDCPTESGTGRHRFLTTGRVALAVAGAAVALPLVAGASPAGAATTPAANIAAAQKAVAQDMKTPTAINQTVPLPKAPPKGKSVVCLADDDVPSDYTICTLGIEPAAKAIGWSYSSIYFDPSNPASLDSALTSALAKNPAAVINVGGQPTSTYSATTLAAYKAAKVPIVMTNVASATPTQTLLGPVNTAKDSVIGATMLANYVIDKSQGKGGVLIVDVPAYSELDAVAKSMTSTLNSKCPGCSVQTLDVSLPQVSAGQIVPTTVTTLKANPNLKYVVFVTSSFGDGIQAGLNAAGLTGISVLGQDMDPTGAASIRNGTEAAHTGGPAIPYLGFISMDMALRHMETGAISSTGDYTAPIQLMTKSNIGNVSVWDAPSNALDQFLKLWKVKS